MYAVIVDGRTVYQNENIWRCRGHRDGLGAGVVKKVLTKVQGNRLQNTSSRKSASRENAAIYGK
jgi:hypothetical protein